MKKLVLFFVIVSGLFISASGQKGAVIYLNYCSGCHGQQLEGGRASALIKDNWKYGKDRYSIITVITNGIPKTEMPKWKGILTTTNIYNITDFILKSQRKPASKKEEPEKKINN